MQYLRNDLISNSIGGLLLNNMNISGLRNIKIRIGHGMRRTLFLMMNMELTQQIQIGPTILNVTNLKPPIFKERAVSLGDAALQSKKILYCSGKTLIWTSEANPSNKSITLKNRRKPFKCLKQASKHFFHRFFTINQQPTPLLLKTYFLKIVAQISTSKKKQKIQK